MQQAGNAEFIVWAIVAVVVMVAKGLGKLATPSADETTPAPKPAPQPRPRVQPRPPAAVRSRRIAVVQHRVPPMAPPIVEAASPVMPSTAAVAEEPPAKPAPAVVPTPQPSRSNQWATALRDRQNIRNVIIANEIIGPPVSLREF